MTLESLNYQLAWPEIFLLIMANVLLIVDVFLPQSKRNISYLIAQLTLLATMALVITSAPEARQLAFNGMFVSDSMSVILKAFICAITFVVFVYSRDYLQERNIFKGEYYVLGLFGVLGMMIMVSASNMLTIYLGLELLSLCLYAMVAINRNSGIAAEAAMKYFVLGAIASGMLLYGMSMVYGMTGSLDITVIAEQLAKDETTSIVMIFGLVFVLVGVAFKFGAVPFHMWVPDVYQGSPTAVTTYLAAAPKIAAFAMMMRLLVEALGALHTDWQGMLIILAVLSMAIGNIVAIAQTNIKRLLAYSTISHIGFIMLGVLAGTADGYSSAMFYTLAYAIMTLAGLGMVLLLARAGFEADQLDDFRGLNDRSPWFAFMMLIVVFSMAGVPPSVGFWAKLAVLGAVIDVDLVWLAVVAVFFSIIGLYYYLRIIKLMYFDNAGDNEPAMNKGADMKLVLSLNALLVLGLGIYPASLLSICYAAFQ